MAIDALVKPFLRLPLFAGLKPLQLTEIVRRAGRIVYKPGDVLIEEDQVSDATIIVISGEAARISGEAPAEIVPEGAMIAELAMLVETVHSATVVAKTSVRALKISREDMHAQMADDPSLAEHMMERIANRLKQLASEIRAIDEVLSNLAVRELASAQQVIPAAANPASASVALH